MGTIVFSFLTVGNDLSLSKFSFIGLLEDFSKWSGEESLCDFPAA